MHLFIDLLAYLIPCCQSVIIGFYFVNWVIICYYYFFHKHGQLEVLCAHWFIHRWKYLHLFFSSNTFSLAQLVVTLPVTDINHITKQSSFSLEQNSIWKSVSLGNKFFFFYTAMHLMHVGIKVGAYQEVTRCGNQPTQWFSKDYFNCCSYLTPGSYFCPWETIDMVWEPLRGSSGSFYLFWVGASIFYYSLAGVHFPLDFFSF